jgi:hypothetical protein
VARAAGVNAIRQLYYVPAFPFWALMMFSVDTLIIYGLVAYAGASCAKLDAREQLESGGLTAPLRVGAVSSLTST